MHLILLERIAHLGQMGDEVRVRDGYARNYLLPQKKALRSSEANRKHFEAQRAQLEVRNLERKGEAEAVATKLNGQSFIIVRQAAETGQLYGSVTTRDLADIITENGFSVGRGQVVLAHPIKKIGVHPVQITLHADVEATITANIARSADEAERQARGEDLTLPFDDDAAEYEATEDDTDTDDSELFDVSDNAAPAETATDEAADPTT